MDSDRGTREEEETKPGDVVFLVGYWISRFYSAILWLVEAEAEKCVCVRVRIRVCRLSDWA